MVVVVEQFIMYLGVIPRAGARVGHLGIFPGAHSPWGAHGAHRAHRAHREEFFFFLVFKKGKK